MTVRQFEKKVSAVLAGYRRYNIISHKTWREDHQLFLSVKLGPEMPAGAAVCAYAGTIVQSLDCKDEAVHSDQSIPETWRKIKRRSLPRLSA